MPEIIYNLDEAKTSLSQLVDRAARGEEIILCKVGKPLAKLVPHQQNPKPRQPGGWEGQVRISEDFDDPLPAEIQALGVRELRHNLSQISGESTPASIPRYQPGSGLTELDPPPDRSHEISISEALAEQRRER